MVRYLFYIIGDLTYQSPLVYSLLATSFGHLALCIHRICLQLVVSP